MGSLNLLTRYSTAELAKITEALGQARRQAAVELGSKLYRDKPIQQANTLNDVHRAMGFTPGRHVALDDAGDILQRRVHTGPLGESPSFTETSYYGTNKLNDPSEYALNSPIARFYNPHEVKRLTNLVGPNATYGTSTSAGFAEPGAGTKFYRMLGYNADRLMNEGGTPITKIPDLYTHDNLMSNTVSADAIATQRLQEGMGQPFPERLIWNNYLGQFTKLGRKFKQTPAALQDMLGSDVSALPHTGKDMGTGYYGEMDRLNMSPLQELRDQAYGHNALRNMIMAHHTVPGIGELGIDNPNAILAARQAAEDAQKYQAYLPGARSLRTAIGDREAVRNITEGQDVNLDALIESMRGSYAEGGGVR